MPTAEEVVAKNILNAIREDLKECNTAESQRMREEADKLSKKLYEEGGDKVLAKVDKLDQDIVKLLEGLEKQMNTPVEVGPCPHCGYDSDDKPKVVGHCRGEDHTATFDEYDRDKMGMKKCTVCGEDIEWD